MTKKEKKADLIKKNAIHEKDTGSSEVQIVLLTERINELALHLKSHTKDLHSRRGLVQMVVKRKKLLEYLKKNDDKSYKEMLKKTGLKK